MQLPLIECMQFMPQVGSNSINNIGITSPLPNPVLMGRPPCCDKLNVKRGLWTPEEDAKMLAYVSTHGIGNWTLVPKKAGLNRCGKSCRLRWTNYLRPDLKHDNFTPQEEQLIINLHQAIGSRWSLIAKWLPGRTDNDVKNYWNTKLRKKLQKIGIDPITHKPFSQIFSDYGHISTGVSSNTNTTLNNSNLIPKPKLPSSSVLTGPSSSNLILNPNMGQIKDISFTPWGFPPQFEITKPHLFNEIVSSSCSSSSSTLTQMNSPKSYSCQQSQTPISASSSCLWNEFLHENPMVSTDFQQQEEKLGSYENCASSSCENQTNNSIDQASSSGASFVDLILDKDKEVRALFPQLLDPSFDY